MLQVAQPRALLPAAIAATPTRAITITTTSTKAVAQCLSIWNTDPKKERFICKDQHPAHQHIRIINKPHQRSRHNTRTTTAHLHLSTRDNSSNYTKASHLHGASSSARRGRNHITMMSGIIGPLLVRLQCHSTSTINATKLTPTSARTYIKPCFLTHAAAGITELLDSQLV